MVSPKVSVRNFFTELQSAVHGLEDQHRRRLQQEVPDHVRKRRPDYRVRTHHPGPHPDQLLRRVLLNKKFVFLTKKQLMRMVVFQHK